MKRLLFVFFLFVTTHSSAQKKYSFVTSTNNISGNFAVLNIAELNDKQNAIFSVSVDNENRAKNPHPIGVWYTGTRWAIYNQDRVSMPADVTYTISVSPRALLVTANADNVNNDKMFIDAAPLNGNSNAKFTVVQNWNPTGSSGIYNNSDIEISYNEGMGKWILQNKSGVAIPNGVSFNIVEYIDGEATLVNSPSAPKSNPPASSPTPVAGSTPSVINANASVAEVKSDPAIYQFMIANKINYPAAKKEPVLKGSTQIGSFVEKHFTQTTYNTENIVFNPPADIMFAGSVIQSKPYFDNNNLYPINKPITPGQITVSRGNGSNTKSYSRTLSANTLASYKDALGNILQGIDMKNSQNNTSFIFKSCRSIEQGMVKAGINFRVTNFSGEAGFDNKNSTTKSYAIGLIKQSFYTVSYQPTSINQNLFLPPTTLTLLQNEGLINAQNQPVYISSVEYGRMFLLVAESESSADSLTAFLNANYQGATVQAGGRLDYASFKSRNSVSVSIYSVGSSDDSKLADDITEDAFRNFLKSEPSASLRNPGVPISFRVRDFLSGADIPTALTADYSEITGSETPVVYEYFVKPGYKNGREYYTKNNTQVTLKKGDVVTITATGSAKHGTFWSIGSDKGPDGQNGEATDPNDPMPCGSNQQQRTDLCECNRYAIICNIPNSNTTKKIYSCVGSGFSNKVMDENMVEPLYFTFNDYETKDGGGEGFNIRVTVIPREQIIRKKVSEPMTK